jgi:hypothetical protein
VIIDLKERPIEIYQQFSERLLKPDISALISKMAIEIEIFKAET